jgi:hypothetical protein
MDHVLHRYSIRALRGLRTLPAPLVPSTRVIFGGTYYQRRGAKFQPQSAIRQVQHGNVSEAERAAYIKAKASGHQDAHVEYINIAPWDPLHPAFLRDSCTCHKCVDPSSKQKNFQTTDIPGNIKAGSVNVLPEGTVEILWENDIPGFEPGHRSIFPRQFFDVHSAPYSIHKSRFQNGKPMLWNKSTITRELEYVNYDEYMNTDEGLFRAVRQVSRYHGSFKITEQLLTLYFA